MTRWKLRGLGAAILILGSFSISGYAAATIAMYRHGAPCGRQAGFVGLLQAAHFVPQGNCAVNSDGSCKSTSSCTVTNPPSGGQTTGKCTTVTSGKTNTCSCISR